MSNGIPPSIHHGRARKDVSHVMPVSSLRLVSRGFNQLLPQWVRYEIVVCSRKWDITAVFFVEMLDGNWWKMLGGNNFHPASSCYTTHKELTYSSTSKLWFRYIFIYRCSSVSHPKYQNPIQQSLTGVSNNSLLIARGHIGCWVELHTASLSEGWTWSMT